MSDYTSIDPQLRSWAEKHALTLFTSSPGGEVRCVYVSSVAGECFQIWIEPPRDDQVCIHAAAIEGRREDDPPQDWRVPTPSLEAALEAVFDTVTAWMAPSERHYPIKP